jgi:hypothetical protein
MCTDERCNHSYTCDCKVCDPDKHKNRKPCCENPNPRFYQGYTKDEDYTFCVSCGEEIG